MELAFELVLKANCRSGVIVFLSRMELAFKFAFKSQLQVWCHMVIKTADVLSNSKRGLGLDIIGFRANSDWTVYTHFSYLMLVWVAAHPCESYEALTYLCLISYNSCLQMFKPIVLTNYVCS